MICDKAISPTSQYTAERSRAPPGDGVAAVQLYGNDGEDGELGEDAEIGAEEDEQGPDDVPAPPAPHEEARPPRAVRDPNMPTPQDRAEHELTHANYRSWCDACVQGKGIAAAHRRQMNEPVDPSGVPTVHFDYCFMGERAKEAEEEKEEESAWEASEDMLKILVVKLGLYKRNRSHLVPKKGLSGQGWVAKAVTNDIKTWGCSNVILKSDQERSLGAIHNEVKRLRAPLMTIPENAPRGESQSNGIVERGVRSTTEQVRTMIVDLETKIGCKLKASHPIMFWLVEHAAFILTHYQVGIDGKTPYERHKGKKSKHELCHFGEKVWYMPLKGHRDEGKRGVRYLEGIWLGINELNGEVMIGTPEGVKRSRSILRKLDKWSREDIEKVKGTPWNLSGTDEEKPEVHFESREIPDKAQPPEDETVNTPMPRRMRIQQKDLEATGYTIGCPGCHAQMAGATHRGHNEECRGRVIKELEKTEEGRKRIEEATSRFREATTYPQAQPEKTSAQDDAMPSAEAPNAAAPDTTEANVDAKVTATTGNRKRNMLTDPLVQRLREAAAKSQVPATPVKRGMSSHEEGEERGGKFQTLPEEEKDTVVEPPKISQNTDTAMPTAPAAASTDATAAEASGAQGASEEQKPNSDMQMDELEEDPDAVTKLAAPLVTGIDAEENIKSINLIMQKGRKIPKAKELIDHVLDMTSDLDVSRVGRPLPADEPGRGAEKDQHRKQATHEAKHNIGNGGVDEIDSAQNLVQRREKHQVHEREDWWRTRFITPDPNRVAWEKVYRRVTMDRDTNEFLEDVQIEPKSKPKDYEYKISDQECRNIKSTFYFREEGPEAKPDVAEVYSPPRITEAAKKGGLKDGFALDLTVRREDGKVWNFSSKKMRDEATEMVLTQKPFMLISSPPCTMYSILQNGNRGRFTKSEWDDKLAEAKVHIDFSLKLFEIQRRMGNYFLFEHPKSASSWKLKEVEALMKKQGVIEVIANMCQFGMTTKYKGEEGLVSKPTRFLTNSPEVAKRLNRRCSEECKQKKHLAIWGTRAREAQRYPPSLCKAVVDGVRAEKLMRETNLCEIDVDMILSCESEDIEDAMARHEDNLTEYAKAWDDVTGKELDPKEVSKARAVEMGYVKDMGVYRVADKAECLRVTGQPPVKSRWLDINKGDDVNKNYRSRWVAKQFKTHDDFELFAATPPLDAIRYILSSAASMKNGKLMSNDVRRAYFFAPATRPIYVELPDEAGEKSDKCGRLLKSLYGTRDAANNWSQAYSKILLDIGFKQGVSNPCLFFHSERNIRTVVHGDDFLSAAEGSQLTWLQKELSKQLDIKTERMGEPEDQKQMKFLNRVITWEKGGIRYEADPRHAEIVVKALGLENGKAVVTPGVSIEGVRDTDDKTNPLMKGAQATEYRAVTARLNFLAQDRPDLQYAVKELSRNMSAPRIKDHEALKRVGRYLLHRPRVTFLYEWQSPPKELTIFTDTDWAGCRTTRKSTSGGIILNGRHYIKSWSRQQNLVSLSSAEAELYGLVKASSEGLGCKAMAGDYGATCSVKVYADASAALGIVHRKGLGKVRHIDTNTLWVQQAACSKRLEYAKVHGKINPADALTKHLTEAMREGHFKRIGMEFMEGRPEAAPKLCK